MNWKNMKRNKRKPKNKESRRNTKSTNIGNTRDLVHDQERRRKSTNKRNTKTSIGRKRGTKSTEGMKVIQIDLHHY